MSRETLSNALVSYLTIKEPHFALLIDGPWGSGKTYYFENFKNTLNGLNKENSKDAAKVLEQNKSQSLNTTYFSVFGQEDLASLKERIVNLLATNGSVEKIISIAQSAVSGLGKDTKKKYYTSKGRMIFTFANSMIKTVVPTILRNQLVASKYRERRLLIIDDLERLSNKIGIDELFGFISSEVIEAFGYHVVIISSLEDLEDNELLNKYKEKVVGHTVKFDIEITEVVKDILPKQGFLYSQRDWVIKVLKLIYTFHDKHLNLRSLNYILEIFATVEGGINSIKVSEEERNSMLKSAFLNTAIIGYETRERNITITDITSISSIINTRLFESSVDENRSGLLIYLRQYINEPLISEDIVFTTEINEVIFSGYFSKESFYRRWFRLNLDKQYRIAIENIKTINNFRKLNDEEVLQAQESLLMNMKNDSLDPRELLGLLNSYAFLKNNKLPVVNNFEEPVFESLKRSIQNLPISDEENLADLEEPYMLPYLYTSLAKDNKILKRTEDTIEEALSSQHRNKKCLYTIAVLEGKANQTDTSITVSEAEVLILLSKDSGLLGEVLKPSGSAYNLTKYVRRFSKFVSKFDNDSYGQLMNALNVLSSKIENYLHGSGTVVNLGKIDRFNLEALNTSLKDLNSQIVTLQS